MAKAVASKQSDLFGFMRPEIKQVIAFGAEIGVPEIECQKFWYFHDARGWMMGKARMKVWKSALHTWRLNWQERQPKPGMDMSTDINGVPNF